MKTRIILVLATLFLTANFSFAQQDEECMLNLTLMNDYVKSKKYDEAFEPWMKVRNKCPKFSYAIYAYGEKILNYKIKNSTGQEKLDYISDLMVVWDKGMEFFPSKYDLGEVLAKKALKMYDNQKDMSLTDKQIYDGFDKAYTQDLENFTSAKGLYVYFTKIVDLYKAEQEPIQDVFNKYDDVSEQLETINAKFTVKLNKLIEKEDAGTVLTKKEGKYKTFYQKSLEANGKISGSLDTYLGQLANCENLIPLYQKDFSTYKNDAVWLKRAVSRMYNKECTDDPLYIELVKAYDATAPSADTKYFVATILYKQNKNKEGDDYIKQAYELETDVFKKGRLAKKIANGYKKRGSYGSARNYYREALKLNPSDGTPHLQIASMYAKSANSCGDTNFNKRAVFWYAAQEALKAGRVDARMKSSAQQAATSYNANAPTKAEIFQQGNAGTTISIGCWIGGSVKVPNL
ncbi:tetratricopeptide repeat protein [Psychroserpens jangbogonensis]|uniref:tetratricopeptide repeat protein n=1 Tax=Psychroserpens jangbogonensis TaxID=1484460 RepID=UPI00053E6B24|nr:tetratricopeptide repeat protein [Psychroserpens jangbogonensis]